MTWTRSLLIFGALVAVGPTPALGAAPSAPTVAPTTDRASRTGPSSLEASRRTIVSGAEAIDGLEEDAKKDQDMPRLNCVMEVQVDAARVTELATNEYLLARNPTTNALQRTLAREKLGAAAETMGELVDEAKQCTFASSDEDPTLTSNSSDENPSITLNDPTAISVVAPQAPPILDPAWLPTASGLF